MNTISNLFTKQNAKRKRQKNILRSGGILGIVFTLCLIACDFQGPWTFYPEETEVYRGIYTYGYIVNGKSPVICFSKLYELDESSAENFAFYDSMFVSVVGKFENGKDSVSLQVSDTDPNCFVAEKEYAGLEGESYEMRAVFDWDSAGHNVHTEYKAVGKIPEGFSVNQFRVPTQEKTYEPKENTRTYTDVKVLEYPMDMSFYKFVPTFNNTVGGVITVAYYDNENGGEISNTTMYNMLKGFLSKDSMGYTGLSINNPDESSVNMGFQSNSQIGSLNNMDTLFVTAMSIPVGKVSMYFYATDVAYRDYENKVLESFEDSRIVAESNIDNGMGVFSGMYVDSVLLNVKAEEYVTYSYMQIKNCVENDDSKTEGWDSKFCRLKVDSFCYDTVNTGDYNSAIDSLGVYYNTYKWCYAPMVKFSMMQNLEKWNLFLPDTISERNKSEAYSDGLKRYCIASNFKSNNLADCSEIYNQCQVTLDSNSCKEYLWQWCADREWDFTTYPQCGTAFISRYYLENQKSPILKQVVDKWCHENPDDTQCKN